MQHNDSSSRRARWARAATVAVLGAGALAATGAAQARDDVFWSLGLASPGVQVALSNTGPQVLLQPAYVQPAPVFVQPAPVYVQPRPVHVRPVPVIYRTAPVMYQPVPVGYRTVGWVPAGHGHGYGEYRRARHHGRDRNHDGIPDQRQDFNGDGRPDWTRR
jgi:hypothetical protein